MRTVQHFGSIIITWNKFGSRCGCQFVRSARVVAYWTDDQGMISPCTDFQPGWMDCVIQHRIKIGEQCINFVVVHWYGADKDKDNVVKFGERLFFLGVHLAFFL